MSEAVPIVADGQVVGVLCYERMEEISRAPCGETRWCFHCRKRRDFVRVVTAPVGMSYYGPTVSVRCTVCNTDDGDCFPGWSRTWDEEDYA